jgi:hypothetical protein
MSNGDGSVSRTGVTAAPTLEFDAQGRAGGVHTCKDMDRCQDPGGFISIAKAIRFFAGKQAGA